MATVAKLSREKISTTISPTAFSFLHDLIEQGKAQNLAEAIDLAIENLLVYENRERLARDTAAHFETMSNEELAEEGRLASALSTSARGLDIDREP